MDKNYIAEIFNRTKVWLLRGYLMTFSIGVMLNSANAGMSSDFNIQRTDTMPSARVTKVPTHAGQYHMTANINGRRWVAATMNPLVPAGMLAGYAKEEFMGLPIDKGDAAAGKRIALSPNNPVELKLAQWTGEWITDNGEIEITMADAHWAEGRFWVHIKSEDGQKSMQISNGSFRVSLDRWSGHKFTK